MTGVDRWVAVVALGALLAACAADVGESQAATADGDGELSGELVVFAAASLTDAFSELAEAFTAEHPDVRVVFNFAGSQVLASQIAEGAPADVFASADVVQMDVVADAASTTAEPVVFTSNLLEIAVEPGNPHGVSALADLEAPDLIVVLPAEAVPAGRYAREALDAAGVALTPASLEQDVRAALAKVELGEADAALVYASDVAAADGRVDGVAIPAEHNVPASYPIAALADASNPRAAAAFVDFVLGAQGQDILAAYGFTSP
jgi:molybdate transport system substrate-binding protein